MSVFATIRLVLTDAGRDYLEACRQILEQVDEAERAASGAYAAIRGRLVVAAPVVFGRLHVVPVVAAFLERHPEVDVQLRLGDRNVNLIEEHVDVALRIGALPDSGLVAVPVGWVRRVVCASPAYLERFGTPRSPEDLADDEPPGVPVQLVRPGQGRLPMKTRAFIDAATPRLRERLDDALTIRSDPIRPDASRRRG